MQEKKLFEELNIKELDAILFSIYKEVHEFIIKNDNDTLVPVESDSLEFCQNALRNIKTVIPYYFREYIEKTDPSRRGRSGFEKLVYVYSKSIMHIRAFAPNKTSIYEYLEQGNSLDILIGYPNSYVATCFAYELYKKSSIKIKEELTPFFHEVHCSELFDSLCDLLEQLGNNLSEITPGLVSYIHHAYILTHKNVTARTTTQLLARDALIPFVKKLVADNQTIGFVYFDIDHFSQVNNDNDHKTGDLLLKQIAERIYDLIKGKGACERHGGEEFLIALPIDTIDNLRKITDTLLKVIRDIPRPKYDKSDPQKYNSYMSATISYGVINRERFANSFVEAYEKALHLLDKSVVDSKSNNKRDIIIPVEL